MKRIFFTVCVLVLSVFAFAEKQPLKVFGLTLDMDEDEAKKILLDNGWYSNEEMTDGDETYIKRTIIFHNGNVTYGSKKVFGFYVTFLEYGNVKITDGFLISFADYVDDLDLIVNAIREKYDLTSIKCKLNYYTGQLELSSDYEREDFEKWKIRRAKEIELEEERKRQEKINNIYSDL